MGVGRRVVLRAAGVGAVAAGLAACAPAPPTPRPAPPPTPTPHRPPDWSALRARLGGALQLPSDPGYAAAALAYNPLYDGRRPAAVAQVATVADVQACVAEAAATGIGVAARGGGHSYAGYSTPDGGLVVDLSRMSSVDVRPDGTAVIGAGARLMDVYTALAAAGRCVPGGSCPTVGIAGLTLGGGIGVLTPKYGLTCDSLLGADIVTADATVRSAAAGAEPELYWALRGGGGGNFGIVTSFTFQTVPAPALALFQLGFPAGSVADVVGGWQRFTAGAPDEMWSTVGISGGDPPTCRVTGCWVGPAATLGPQLDALVAATGTRPTSRYTAAKGYLDAMRWFGGCTSYTDAQCRPAWTGAGAIGREPFVASSAIMHAPLADPTRLSGLLDGRPDVDVLLDAIGGAAGRVASGATAFPHRGALANAQIYLKTTPQGAAAATARLGEVRTAMSALLGAGGYVNYIDPALPDWAQAYYGANLPRLRGVARTYDPQRLFAFAQGLA